MGLDHNRLSNKRTVVIGNRSPRNVLHGLAMNERTFVFACCTFVHITIVLSIVSHRILAIFGVHGERVN